MTDPKPAVAEPTTQEGLIQRAADVIKDGFDHAGDAPCRTKAARALADAGLLADPEQQRRLDRYIEAFQEQTTELEELRAAFEQEKHDSAWVLARVRRNLGTPDGRAVSVHAAEVRKERDQARKDHADLLAQRDSWWEQVGRERAELTAERDLALWLHAEAAWRVAGFDVLTVKLAQINQQMQARIDAALAKLDGYDGYGAGMMFHDELRAALQGSQPAESGGSETGGNAAEERRDA